MTSALDLQGIVVPIVTPVQRSGAVDVTGLKRLVAYTLNAGVHGIWVLGATGDFSGLTDFERDSAIEAVVEAVAGRVPVLAGCIEQSPARCVERARRAEVLGADAVFATTPGFAPVSQAEVLTHFRMLKAATSLPVVAYNAQYATQTPLPIATIRTLAKEGTLAGLKDSADFGDFRQLVVALSDLEDFPIVTGIQFLADCALLMGARGCIPPLGNVVPQWFVEVYDSAKRGDWSHAAEVQNRIAAFNVVVREWAPGASVFGAFFGMAMVALNLLGVLDEAVVVDPYPAPTASQAAIVREHLHSFGLLPRLETAGRLAASRA
jgi:4-hydroxy-tetrahydrodipicolinate synthase